MANSTILKMMTNGMEDEDLLEMEKMNFEDFSTKAVKEFRKIPLDRIKKRGINDYSISDIEPLAKSIIDNGLQQHIVVKTDGDDYVLIAGERRVTAYRWIIDKYKAEGRNYESFLTIPAEVYTSISKKQEEEIYRTTNDTQRNSSMFERIYRFNPCEKFFYKAVGQDGFEKSNEPDVAKIADYFRLKRPEKRYDFEKSDDELAMDVAQISRNVDVNTPFVTYHQNTSNQVVTIRWDDPKVMYEYIRLKLIEQNSDINPSASVVRKYANWIVSTYKPIIREFIFCQNPPLFAADLKMISILSLDEQKEIYEQLKKGTYNANKQEQVEVATEEVKELTYEEKFNNYIKKLELMIKEFETNEFTSHKKELTGNQKELLKEVNKVIKNITKIKEMPH